MVVVEPVTVLQECLQRLTGESLMRCKCRQRKMAPCENNSVSMTVRTTFAEEVSNTSIRDTFGLLGNSFGEDVREANCSFWNDSVQQDSNCSLSVNMDEVKLNKFQIIKAVVLAGVTVVIMISVCRMVFQLFVRYNVRHDR